VVLPEAGQHSCPERLVRLAHWLEASQVLVVQQEPVVLSLQEPQALPVRLVRQEQPNPWPQERLEPLAQQVSPGRPVLVARLEQRAQVVQQECWLPEQRLLPQEPAVHWQARLEQLGLLALSFLLQQVLPELLALSFLVQQVLPELLALLRQQ
jgi:hypothetical protein